MRIVLTDSTLNSDVIGGAQTFLAKLASGLVLNGSDVHVLSDGIPNTKVAGAFDSSRAVFYTDLLDKQRLVEDIAPDLADWLHDLAPDVYAVSVSPDIGWLVLPYLDPSIATVAIGHTDSETFYLPARHYRPFVTRAVGVSEQVCSNFVENCGFAREDVDFIPYGVEGREGPPTENDPNEIRLVYVGRLEEHQKRVSDIVAVAKKLTISGINYRLSIVGDGEEMAAMRRELAHEIDSGRVVFHGWLDSRAVQKELQSSDIFLLASAYEGFCISLIEALANGCCPIVTDIKSGNSQMITSGDNGFIVPIGDVGAFGEKVRMLDTDRKELLRLRRNAWKSGKKYGIDRMVQSYLACFEKAVEQVKIEPRTIDSGYPLMETCRSKYPLWMRRLKKRALSLVK